MRVIDITGQRFNRLVAIGREGSDKRGQARFRFRCDCGNETVAIGKDVRTGHTKSCGCLDREATAGRAIIRNRIHGMTNTPEFHSWRAMITRCTQKSHPHWRRYGGRGITICARWLEGENGKSGFECFYEDMGKRDCGLSLDRINNDGNYCKENCRWATPKQQMANRSVPAIGHHDPEHQEHAANI